MVESEVLRSLGHRTDRHDDTTELGDRAQRSDANQRKSDPGWVAKKVIPPHRSVADTECHSAPARPPVSRLVFPPIHIVRHTRAAMRKP
jgi:hypothetical protein